MPAMSAALTPKPEPVTAVVSISWRPFMRHARFHASHLQLPYVCEGSAYTTTLASPMAAASAAGSPRVATTTFTSFSRIAFRKFLKPTVTVPGAFPATAALNFSFKSRASAAAIKAIAREYERKEAERARKRQLKGEKKKYEPSSARPAAQARPKERSLRYENVTSAREFPFSS